MAGIEHHQRQRFARPAAHRRCCKRRARVACLRRQRARRRKARDRAPQRSAGKRCRWCGRSWDSRPGGKLPPLLLVRNRLVHALRLPLTVPSTPSHPPRRWICTKTGAGSGATSGFPAGLAAAVELLLAANPLLRHTHLLWWRGLVPSGMLPIAHSANPVLSVSLIRIEVCGWRYDAPAYAASWGLATNRGPDHDDTSRRPDRTRMTAHCCFSTCRTPRAGITVPHRLATTQLMSLLRTEHGRHPSLPPAIQFAATRGPAGHRPGGGAIAAHRRFHFYVKTYADRHDARGRNPRRRAGR